MKHSYPDLRRAVLARTVTATRPDTCQAVRADMSHNRAPAALLLDDRARPCGVCGTYRILSKTHVPPQAAGNTKAVKRTNMMSTHGEIGPGRWQIGGMWVRGLCTECNNFAGSRYDQAYADFACRLLAWFEAGLGSTLWFPGAQAIPVAPGRVTRSALSGMLGISPHLRILHPTLATQMKSGGPVRLPGNLTLQIAAYLGNDAYLTGPMLSGVMDGHARTLNTLAAITFRPLSWALATSDSKKEFAERGWIDASEWLLYEDGRETYDLRWLVPGGLPLIKTILHAPSDDAVQMYSGEITPIMVGRIP